MNSNSGKKFKIANRTIDLDTYDSSIDSNGYIFNSFRRELNYEYEFPLVSHCNLNCQMCTVFSPIAKKSFLSLENFYRDLFRMGDLFGSQNVWFRMVGGEPLLHPGIKELMILARKILPEALISITTNGILLYNMDNEFYKIAQRKNIVILISPYPPIDTDFLLSYLRSKGVISFRTVKKFTSRKIRLDVNGKQNAVENFKRCGYRCNFILDGKLSRCFYPLVIKHFNMYFGHKLNVNKDDFINIHDYNVEQIKMFLNSPIPFCKYCKNDEKEYFAWKKSSKQIYEWI